MGAASQNRVARAACHCTVDPGMCLSDDERVTQLDERDGSGFRMAPRVDPEEFGVSVMRGTLTLEETFQLVTKGMPLPAPGSRRVRYASVGSLREAGFEVVHTPSRRLANHPHCSVVVPSQMGELDPIVPWDAGVREAFQRCFNESEREDER